jgi:hypothetical protein
LEAVVSKPPNDAQLTLNNNLLITNSTQPEAALSLLASWHLRVSDAICVKPEALMSDPEQYPETPSISDALMAFETRKYKSMQISDVFSSSIARLNQETLLGAG